MKYLFLLILFCSCKKEKINQYYNIENNCNLKKWDGLYLKSSVSGVDWKFTDSLKVFSVKEELKIEFPEQTNINNISTHYYAPNNCNIKEFAFRNDSLNIIYYMLFEKEIIKSYVIHDNDTSSIKIYKKIYGTK